MIYLLIFILGFVTDRYFLQIADLLLQKYANNKQLQTTECQFKIDRISNESKLESADTQYELTLIQKDINDIGAFGNENAIGFNINDCVSSKEDDFDDFDEEEEYYRNKDKNKLM